MFLATETQRTQSCSQKKEVQKILCENFCAFSRKDRDKLCFPRLVGTSCGYFMSVRSNLFDNWGKLRISI